MGLFLHSSVSLEVWDILGESEGEVVKEMLGKLDCKGCADTLLLLFDSAVGGILGNGICARRISLSSSVGVAADAALGKAGTEE
mmetsp:Transcript_5031/g.10613  ORF Transcript_5031/g.10613 Transcript_5031/m.10613 type:complete len:84 (+) Transcript_5031:257-508(+)